MFLRSLPIVATPYRFWECRHSPSTPWTCLRRTSTPETLPIQMIHSTEIATPPKSTTSRNSKFPGTISNWAFAKYQGIRVSRFGRFRGCSIFIETVIRAHLRHYQFFCFGTSLIHRSTPETVSIHTITPETWLIHMRHDSSIRQFTWDRTDSYETWLIHTRHDSSIRRFTWDRTHSYETWLSHMRHDSSIRRFRWYKTHSYETWLIHASSHLWQFHHSPSTPETWLIHMRHDLFIWDMTHSYETWFIHMRHDSFMIFDSFPWLIHMRHVTHSYETWLIHMRHDSFMIFDSFIIRPPQLQCEQFIWDITHPYDDSNETEPIHMRHDSSTRRFILDRTHSYEMWLIHTTIHMRQNSFLWDVTHPHDDSYAFIGDTTHFHLTVSVF